MSIKKEIQRIIAEGEAISEINEELKEELNDIEQYERDYNG